MDHNGHGGRICSSEQITSGYLNTYYHNTTELPSLRQSIQKIAEKNLKTTPGSDCALNALAIDEPFEYAKLYLDGTMQMWVDAEDSKIN